jgi:outer membrane protein, heavy metal efflux system
MRPLVAASSASHALGVALGVLILIGQPRAGSATAAAVPGANVGELLVMVRNFNPEVAAAALDREAAVAKIYPAGALDDPMVNLSRDQGFRQTLFSVSQDFPLWGKRALRQEVAEADAAAAKAREGGALNELREQVKSAFAQYYEAARSIRVTREIHGLLHGMAESVRLRYAQGLGTQSDAIRAELEQTRLEPELASFERDETTAKAKINALIGRPADAALAEPAVLRRIPPAGTLKLDALMLEARNANPALAAAGAEIAVAEGARRLIDKSWYPDVTVTLGGDSLPNMPVRVVAGVGIKVPLQWGVRDAEAQEATAKKGAAELRKEAAALKIESELQSALASLSRAQHTADLLAHALGPQSEAAYRSALASYEAGRGDLTAVLDAAHQQLRVRVELLRTGTEAQMAFAVIERLTGGEL